MSWPTPNPRRRHRRRLILALLLLVLLLTVAIARSMVTPLRRLRTEALEIAGFRLPDVVRNLRVTGDAARPRSGRSPIDGDDEIGEVARAFDQVHRQAVRLAGEEADLRGNISSMFVNLSRRTQTLVERQISLIDGLEKGEQDGGAWPTCSSSTTWPPACGATTRTSWSSPGTSPPAGAASRPSWSTWSAPRCRRSRATSASRSRCTAPPPCSAAPPTTWSTSWPSWSRTPSSSRRRTPGVVSSSLIEGGGALLSVNDAGISMTEDELAEANRRLAEPPVVDVSVSRRMGLFVVGRLALRHGIRVQLRKGDGDGLIAMVLLPPTLIRDRAAAGRRWPGAPRRRQRGGTTQEFGPFQPSGANAPTGSLFGAHTWPGARAQALPRPYEHSAGRRYLAAPSRAPAAAAARRPGLRARRGRGDHGGTAGVSARRRPPSPGSDRPPAPDAVRHAAAGDVLRHAARTTAAGPHRRSRSDPFARGLRQRWSPRRAPGPLRPGANDSGAFTRSGAGAAADRRPEPPRRSPASSAGPSRRPGAQRLRQVRVARRPNAFDSTAFDTGAFGRPRRRRTAVPRVADTGEFRRRDPREAPPTFSAWNAQDDDPVTASMPAVEVSSLESEEEFLPIFASVESAWFRKPEPQQPDDSARIEAERVERALKAESERLEEWESARAMPYASAEETSGEPPRTPDGAPPRPPQRSEPRRGHLGGTAQAHAQGQPRAGNGRPRAGSPQRPAPMPPVSAERVAQPDGEPPAGSPAGARKSRRRPWATGENEKRVSGASGREEEA